VSSCWDAGGDETNNQSESEQDAPDGDCAAAGVGNFVVAGVGEVPGGDIRLASEGGVSWPREADGGARAPVAALPAGASAARSATRLFVGLPHLLLVEEAAGVIVPGVCKATLVSVACVLALLSITCG
jgi:hypothetical protein